MRYITAIALALLSGIASFAIEPVLRAKDVASLYVVRFRDRDLEGVAALTHPRFVEKMGGSARYVEVMRQSAEQLRQQGIELAAATIAEPSARQLIGETFVTFVPVTIAMKSSTHTVTMFSHLLGISHDGGGTWRFVDLVAITDEQIHRLFPAFAAELKMPERRKAIVTEAEPGATDNPDDAQRLREDH